MDTKKLDLNPNYDPLIFNTNQSDLILNYLKEFHFTFFTFLNSKNILHPFLEKYILHFNELKYSFKSNGMDLYEAKNESLKLTNNMLNNDIKTFIKLNPQHFNMSFDLDLNNFIDSDSF